MKQFWENKNILITGGTSGLGRALALELSQRGARVAVVARRREGLEQLKGINPQIARIAGDISDKNQIHRIYAEAQMHLGRIDVLFNNASRLGTTPLRLLLDSECEDLTQVLETNVIGPFRLTKLVLPEMILNGFGLVVNISCLSGCHLIVLFAVLPS